MGFIRKLLAENQTEHQNLGLYLLRYNKQTLLTAHTNTAAVVRRSVTVGQNI